MDITR